MDAQSGGHAGIGIDYSREVTLESFAKVSGFRRGEAPGARNPFSLLVTTECSKLIPW